MGAGVGFKYANRKISTARGWVKSRRLDALKVDVGNTNSLSI